jgi:histidinol-phosphate aminotransferase
VWRPWLTEALTRLGLTVTPSVANFLLVHFKDAEAANAHLLRHGIIARKMAAYGLPNCLRISIGTEDECRAVADAIATLVGKG